MDAASHRLANVLVGNEPGEAALEVTLLGPELRLEAPAIVAVTGADLSVTVDGATLPMNMPRRCSAGAVIRFGPRSAGTRAYVAFDGGVDVPLSLGSRATHVVSGLGGLDGRALKAGDRLGLGSPAASSRSTRSKPAPEPTAGARLRVLPGPQGDYFDDGALDALQQTRFIISPQSDRRGYRLIGASDGRPPRGDMISDATFIGAIQVPPSGDPILLMADRQTTGGYPQIATVITADLPKAGQLAPGDWIEFAVCTRAEAIVALRDQDEALRGI
jgi:antagonist of KipI